MFENEVTKGNIRDIKRFALNRNLDCNLPKKSISV